LDVNKINPIKALQLLRLADSMAIVKDLITPQAESGLAGSGLARVGSRLYFKLKSGVQRVAGGNPIAKRVHDIPGPVQGWQFDSLRARHHISWWETQANPVD
jgi:hypothetical protein